MRTQLGLVVFAMVMVTTRLAHADAVSLLGWTADGKFVVEIKGKELQQCAPTDLETARAGKDACKRCAAPTGDAVKECGLVTKRTGTASLTSPDKKLVLTKQSRCIEEQSGGGDCYIEVTFGALGGMTRTEAGGSNDQVKPQVDVWYRPDSNALMIDLYAVTKGVRDSDFRIVDVAALRGRSAAPAVVRAIVTEQLAKLATPATWATTSALFVTDEAARGTLDAAALAAALKATGPAKADAIDVGVTLDGTAAWVTITATINKVAWRGTELAVRDAGTWRIAAGMWSRGMPDADANAKAAAGQLPKPAAVTTKANDEFATELDGWVVVMRASKTDWATETLGAKRGGTVTIGTAPKERVPGGKILDGAWRGWAKGGVVIGPVRGVRIGTAAWLLANVEVTKTKAGKSYVLPVRVWLAIDSTGEPEVQGVVLAHFAVPQL